MTISSRELTDSLELYEFAPGKKASWQTLKRMLPDVETALFFGKAYAMSHSQLGELLDRLFQSTVLEALMEGTHSTELQDYLVDIVPPAYWQDEDPQFSDDAPPPQGEILPELWEAAEVKIAKSIAEVCDQIGNTLDAIPSKEGEMVFTHMAKLNRQRPTIGVYQASIHHKRVQQNLVILDVSMSMSAATIRKIIGDVVALSWKANAYLAIVSDHTYVWEPGTYNVDGVLDAAEFSGTHYETLLDLLQQQWGSVITIADYDSSVSAKHVIARDAKGEIGKVFDISLVNRPTYLAECVGQLANEVETLLVASTHRVLAY